MNIHVQYNYMKSSLNKPQFFSDSIPIHPIYFSKDFLANPQLIYLFYILATILLFW